MFKVYEVDSETYQVSIIAVGGIAIEMCLTFDSRHFRIIVLSVYALTMLGVVLMNPTSIYAQPSAPQSSPLKEISKESWYFRWGDSPVDERGAPLWAYEDAVSSKWKPVKDSPDFWENPQKHQTVWLLTHLPEGHWQQPTFSILGVSQSFEVYLDRRRIYEAGEFRASAHNKYIFTRSHHIPLEDVSSKKALLLRVYSEDAHPDGILEDAMWLGHQMDMVRKIIRFGTETFILGSLFVFVGLFSVFIYFRRRAQKSYFTLGFGIFASSIGMSYLASSPISGLFVESSIVRYYWLRTAFLSFPIGLYMFIEQISRDRELLIRRLWQLHIFVAVAFLLLDITDVYPISKMYSLFTLLMLFGISVGIYKFSRGGTSRGIESKTMSIGTAILVLSGLHDTLLGLRIIPQWRLIFPWGVLAFILSLGYILESRFMQAQRDLEAYSKELEAKSEELKVSNEKLEEYSQTLEQKVEERTQQLRETQDQLIMQEKMASLGNLVAGVAHEMNNPIGAIHSSSDVANRGIRKLKELLQINPSEYRERGVQQSLSILEANHRVIAMASKRVAKIVESLRAFSRLDEATFQEVDLHKSIDTALNLLQHELRDKVAVIKNYGEPPRIRGYASELNQVFMNLLMNAVQAIEDHGTIKITTSADESQITVRISDTGKGIPSEHLSRIFDPGFTSRDVGIGLGLSIVYKTIKKHQGDVKVESEVGKGTEITITLPTE